MSETTQSAEAAATPNDVAEAAKGKPQETPEQTIEALRAALAKANAEAKDNRIKASQLDEIKASQMSEIERAKAETEQYRTQAQQASLDALRFRIAAETGITQNVDLILTAPDEETMRAQAALWSSRVTSPTTPKPDLTQGGQGGAPLALNSDGLEEALRSKLGI